MTRMTESREPSRMVDRPSSPFTALTLSSLLSVFGGMVTRICVLFSSVLNDLSTAAGTLRDEPTRLAAAEHQPVTHVNLARDMTDCWHQAVDDAVDDSSRRAAFCTQSGIVGAASRLSV
jgi:hypothetical protein